MSTKIFNGYRILRERSSSSPLVLAQTLRSHIMRHEARQKLVRIISLAIALDQQINNNAPVTHGSLWDKAVKQLSTMIEQNVSVLIAEDAQDATWWYLRYFHPTDDMSALESFPGVQEFLYWDNGDPLKGVSEDEWTERGNTWKQVCDTSLPLELTGVIVELESTYSSRGRWLNDNHSVYNKNFASDVLQEILFHNPMSVPQSITLEYLLQRTQHVD